MQPWLRLSRAAALRRRSVFTRTFATNRTSTAASEPNVSAFGHEEDIEPDPDDFVIKLQPARYNELGNVQMIPQSIRDQIFPEGNNESTMEQIHAAEAQMFTLGHDPKKRQLDPDDTVHVNIPKLYGRNIADHFRIIGAAQMSEYEPLFRQLNMNEFDLPDMPEEDQWVTKSGWWRYARGGRDPQPVPAPLEPACFFDCETAVNDSPMAVMAIALTSEAWYSWVSPRFDYERVPRDRDDDELFFFEVIGKPAIPLAERRRTEKMAHDKIRATLETNPKLLHELDVVERKSVNDLQRRVHQKIIDPFMALSEAERDRAIDTLVQQKRLYWETQKEIHKRIEKLTNYHDHLHYNIMEMSMPSYIRKNTSQDPMDTCSMNFRLLETDRFDLMVRQRRTHHKIKALRSLETLNRRRARHRLPVYHPDNVPSFVPCAIEFQLINHDFEIDPHPFSDVEDIEDFQRAHRRNLNVRPPTRLGDSLVPGATDPDMEPFEYPNVFHIEAEKIEEYLQHADDRKWQPGEWGVFAGEVDSCDFLEADCCALAKIQRERQAHLRTFFKGERPKDTPEYRRAQVKWEKNVRLHDFRDVSGAPRVTGTRLRQRKGIAVGMPHKIDSERAYESERLLRAVMCDPSEDYSEYPDFEQALYAPDPTWWHRRAPFQRETDEDKIDRIVRRFVRYSPEWLQEEDVTYTRFGAKPFVPFSTEDRAQLIIGHNVGYDRARILTEYCMFGNRTRFFDTMSMHMTINGLSEGQRPAFFKESPNWEDRGRISVDEYMTWAREEDNETPWWRHCSLSSLRAVYDFYCDIDMGKEDRELFLDGSMHGISECRQSLLHYCALDVGITHRVYFEGIFQYRNYLPHPVSIFGTMEMGSMFLPVRNTFWKWVDRVHDHHLDQVSKLDAAIWKRVREIVDQDRRMSQFDNFWFVKDPFLSQLDWSIPRRRGEVNKRTGKIAPPKPVRQTRPREPRAPIDPPMFTTDVHIDTAPEPFVPSSDVPMWKPRTLPKAFLWPTSTAADSETLLETWCRNPDSLPRFSYVSLPPETDTNDLFALDRHYEWTKMPIFADSHFTDRFQFDPNFSPLRAPRSTDLTEFDDPGANPFVLYTPLDTTPQFPLQFASFFPLCRASHIYYQFPSDGAKQHRNNVTTMARRLINRYDEYHPRRFPLTLPESHWSDELYLPGYDNPSPEPEQCQPLPPQHTMRSKDLRRSRWLGEDLKYQNATIKDLLWTASLPKVPYPDGLKLPRLDHTLATDPAWGTKRLTRRELSKMSSWAWRPDGLEQLLRPSEVELLEMERPLSGHKVNVPTVEWEALCRMEKEFMKRLRPVNEKMAGEFVTVSLDFDIHGRYESVEDAVDRQHGVKPWHHVVSEKIPRYKKPLVRHPKTRQLVLQESLDPKTTLRHLLRLMRLQLVERDVAEIKEALPLSPLAKEMSVSDYLLWREEEAWNNSVYTTSVFEQRSPSFYVEHPVRQVLDDWEREQELFWEQKRRDLEHEHFRIGEAEAKYRERVERMHEERIDIGEKLPDALPKWICTILTTREREPLGPGLFVLPFLMGARYMGYPLTYHDQMGWGIKVPRRESRRVARRIGFARYEFDPLVQVKKMQRKVDVLNMIFQWQTDPERLDGVRRHDSQEDFDFIRIRHPDGRSTNGTWPRVMSPFDKSCETMFASGDLTADRTEMRDLLVELISSGVYWSSMGDRIRTQLVVPMSPCGRHPAVWDDAELGDEGFFLPEGEHEPKPFAYASEFMNDPRVGGDDNVGEGFTPRVMEAGPFEGVAIEWGAILPAVQAAGTVTRRAVEATWLTAPNANRRRHGTELKAQVIAPPGYRIVGADVDSEELWIASMLGDAATTNMHGGTVIGWMTLMGRKEDGTDMHSNTARVMTISRDHAKVINYSRIYGAGEKGAALNLLRFDPDLSMNDAEVKAKRIMMSTKGIRLVKLWPETAALCFQQPIEHFKDKWFAEIDIEEIGQEMLSKGYWYRQTWRDLICEKTWVGGSESYMFSTLEKMALTPYTFMETPALGVRCCDGLNGFSLATDRRFDRTRVNWIVQSSGVDYLHLLMSACRWLFDEYNIRARLCFSIHDEIRYLVAEGDADRAALAMHIGNLLVRAFFSYRAGLNDLPLSASFFSGVDIDTHLRKEVHHTCVTPSNRVPIPDALCVDVRQALERTRGCLGKRTRLPLYELASKLPCPEHLEQFCHPNPFRYTPPRMSKLPYPDLTKLRPDMVPTKVTEGKPETEQYLRYF